MYTDISSSSLCTDKVQINSGIYICIGNISGKILLIGKKRCFNLYE